MCNEREENGIFWGLMLKPSTVTTRNSNIIFKCFLFYFYMSRPNLSTHTTKGIYIYNFAIVIIGIQGLVDQTYTFIFSFFLSLAITLPSIDTKQIWPYINNLAIVVAMTN
jgi:hypothetical protein